AIENAAANLCHTARNDNALQPATAVESTSTDTRHAVGNVNTLKPGTAKESTRADARHAVGNCNIREPGYPIKSAPPDFRDGMPVGGGRYRENCIGHCPDARDSISAAVKPIYQLLVGFGRNGWIGGAAAIARAV